MKIAIWKTGHEIADRVADSLVKGIEYGIAVRPDNGTKYYDAEIGYGILRGTAEAFKKAEISGKPWFNVDRGYFNPSHYDGYYRISYKGTQAKYDPAFNAPEYDIGLEPIRKYDKSKPVLICPPTGYVMEFFDLKNMQFGFERGKHTGWTMPGNFENYIFRKKGDSSPIPWNDISAVVTFNSSVGWQAIQCGIPCLSDTTHSVVGSYYSTNSLDELIDMFNSKAREPLLNFMRAHQFTLVEIEQGKAWPLINHYLCTSVTTAEKPYVAMSPPIPSVADLQKHFQSNT